MTEGEWSDCPDPIRMLAFLRDSGNANPRELTLFACACLRSRRDLLPKESGRYGVEDFESWAEEWDFQETESLWYNLLLNVLDAVEPLVPEALHEIHDRFLRGDLQNAETAPWQRWCVRFGTCMTMGTDPFVTALAALIVLTLAAFSADQTGALSLELGSQAGNAALLEMIHEEEAQARLLRDVFGNPFRPVSVDPTWLTPTVQALAQAAYEERQLPSGHLDPARLGVLADALEDAACADRTILDHLRGSGPHVRGCWCVDLLLGKS